MSAADVAERGCPPSSAAFVKAHRAALGKRLLESRKLAGLSLAGVEEKSRGRWKAVVVGSYERGDRAVTTAKVMELAHFYGTDPAWLLTGKMPLNAVATLRKIFAGAAELSDEALANLIQGALQGTGEAL